MVILLAPANGRRLRWHRFWTGITTVIDLRQGTLVLVDA